MNRVNSGPWCSNMLTRYRTYEELDMKTILFTSSAPVPEIFLSQLELQLCAFKIESIDYAKRVRLFKIYTSENSKVETVW